MNQPDETEHDRAGAFKPMVVQVGLAPAERAHSGLVRFSDVLKAATPHVFMTPLLALGCALGFGVMVVSGVSPLEPTPEDALRFGANFGPSLVLDHESWRLLSCQFIHYGLLHIGFNLWCLLAMGPLVERLYGNAWFLLIYVLSGVGGALTSVVVHPLTVSAGASGAIFGTIGALGAFLILRHRVMPLKLLRPLRGSVLSFVGYNLLFGLADSRIDTAAHLGGLATGFLVGLLVQPPWPITRGTSGLGRRLLGAAMALGLMAGVGVAAERAVRRSPAIEGLVKDTTDRQAAMENYNRMIAGLRPLIARFEGIEGALEGLIDRLQRREIEQGAAIKVLTELRSDCEENLDDLSRVPAPGRELQGIRGSLENAQRQGRDAVELLLEAFQGRAATPMDVSKEFQARRQRAHAAIDRFGESVRAYAAAHDLTLEREK